MLSKRVVLLTLVAIVVIWIAPLFGGVLGKWGYIIVYSSAIVALFVLIVRQSYRDFPTEAAAATTTERSISLSVPFSQVSSMIPRTVKNCGWKSMQVNQDQGHFKAKIGISRKTWWQTVSIDLTEMDGNRTKVAVRCVAPHILWDRGQNDKMIDKFYYELERLTKSQQEKLRSENQKQEGETNTAAA